MQDSRTIFIAEVGKEGLVYITSPDIPGLLVAGETVVSSLEELPRVLEQMQ